MVSSKGHSPNRLAVVSLRQLLLNLARKISLGLKTKDTDCKSSNERERDMFRATIVVESCEYKRSKAGPLLETVKIDLAAFHFDVVGDRNVSKPIISRPKMLSIHQSLIKRRHCIVLHQRHLINKIMFSTSTKFDSA